MFNPATLRPQFAALLLTLGGLSGTQAALVINNGDIVGNHYVYDLTYAEMVGSTVFNNDVLSQTRSQVVQEGPGAPRFVSPDMNDNSGYTSAEFIYKFDFSTTSYLPTSLNIYDSLTAVWDGGPHETLTTAYSLDGVNYTTIRSLTTVGADSFEYLDSRSANVIDLSSNPSALYYKVTYVANDSTFGFSWNGAQWNRVVDDMTPFTADFTVASVPEPTAGALWAGAGIFAMFQMRRKRVG